MLNLVCKISLIILVVGENGIFLKTETWERALRIATKNHFYCNMILPLRMICLPPIKSSHLLTLLNNLKTEYYNLSQNPAAQSSQRSLNSFV